MPDLAKGLEERRRRIAERLLQFQREGRAQDSYEFEQARQWFYCLSEFCGERRHHEEFWAWVARVAAE